MKKILKWTFGIFIISLLVMLVIFSRWNKEIEEISYPNLFSAKRNEVGIWKIQTSTPQGLGFAFGCLQARDRLFQTELMRRLGAGRLSEWFGDLTLSRDRLMRFGAEVSKWEWQQVQTNPDYHDTKILIQSYVEGRNACLETTPSPIEFLMLGEKNENAKWEPWEVLAISRAHTADFSYDVRDEVGRHAIKNLMGPLAVENLTPTEPSDSKSLYDQVPKPSLRFFDWKKDSSKVEPFFPLSQNSETAFSKMEQKNYSGFDLVQLDALTGASNAWLVQNKLIQNQSQTIGHLCNDTHLGLLWPSTLYPIQYELNLPTYTVKGTGFMLPGIPSLNIGQVTTEQNQKTLTSLQWGITIANYVDSQNLVETNSKVVLQNQSYLVRDPKTKKTTNKIFTERWSDWGPIVNDILDWMGAKAPDDKLLAYNWAAFQKQKTVLPFFVNRTLYGLQNLKSDFANWKYPSVNFNWLQWDTSGLFAGHVMTGNVFQDASVIDRKNRTDFISQQHAQKISVSTMKDRPYYFQKIDDSSSIFLASANHRIYPGDLGLEIAYQWHEGSRGRRLAELKDKIVQDPESAQYDLKSIELTEFRNLILPHLNSEILCSKQIESCQNILREIQNFDGQVTKDSWVVTVLSLWERNLKLSLWSKQPAQVSLELKDSITSLYQWWDRSPSSKYALFQFLKKSSEKKLTSNVKSKTNPHNDFWSNLKVNELAQSSFHKTLQDLSKLNPDPKSWTWKSVHHVQWQHPFLKLQGTVGSILKNYIFPKGPEMDGNNDSPAVMLYYWNPDNPTDFSAVHGPVMRTCMQTSLTGQTQMRLANITGVSGNPFSKYSKKLSEDYFFENKKFEIPR